MKITLYLHLLYQGCQHQLSPVFGTTTVDFQFHFLIHHEAASLPELIIPSPIALAIFPAPINPMLTESGT